MLPLSAYVSARLGLGTAPYLGVVSAPRPLWAGNGVRPRPSRVGGSGTSIASGFIDSLEHNVNLEGSKWYGEHGQLGIAGKMMRDSHVRQSIAYVTDPLRAATWRFRPASTDPLHVEQADYAQWAFVESLAWDKILKKIVTNYCVDGFSLSEMTDDYRGVPVKRFPLHPGRGRGIVPTAFHEIPGNTVHRWHPDESDSLRLASIEQYQPYSDADPFGFRTVPADRILRYTYDQQGGDFSGFAVLRSAYGPFKCKLAFLAIDAIKHERRGVGTPILILGEEVSDEDIDAAERTLEQMRTNAKGYAIFPNGWTFTWDTGSQTEGTDLNAAIARCDIAIAHNVSAGFSMLGVSTPSGSYGLSYTQKDQYHLSIVGHSRFFADGLVLGADGWSPVRRILEANYKQVDALPRLEAHNLPTKDRSVLIPQLINAANVGLITRDNPLEDYVRESCEAPPRDPSSAREWGNGKVAVDQTAGDPEHPGEGKETAE